MRTLSLWQPWASLVVLGIKRVETRSWSTTPGELAIHAARRPPPPPVDDELALAYDLLEQAGYGRDRGLLPLGAVVGVVEVLGSFKVERGSPLPPVVDRVEEALGDYRPGRFGWPLARPRELMTPVLFPGRQRVFEGPDLAGHSLRERSTR